MRPIEPLDTEYVVQNLTLSPVWTVELAKAMLLAHLAAGVGHPFWQPDPESLAAECLEEASQIIMRHHPPRDVPIGLIERVSISVRSATT
jgi:hypothetical protein